MERSHIPWVPGANVFGHMNRFRDDRLPLFEDIGRCGDICKARFLHRTVYFVNSPQLIHEVLVEKAKSFEKSPGLRLMLRELAGEGLFTAEGDLWRKQRKLMSPLFHPQQLSVYAKEMNAAAHRALGRWAEGERLDLAREMTRITMSVVGATLFGNAGFDEADDLGEALTLALGWADKRGASAALSLQITLLELFEEARDRSAGRPKDIFARLVKGFNSPFLLPGYRDQELHDSIKKIDSRIQGMITERRTHPQDKKDLLTRLLHIDDRDEGRMSDKQVRDEANTLFVAGHETTATALAWAFYLLARNPKAMAKAQAEADSFDPQGPIEYDATRLSYCIRVFKEALRIYPPVMVLPRRTLEPVTIGKEHFGVRTLIFVSPYSVHMRPDIWSAPHLFDPDRFLPENENARHKDAYLPFGAGPRVCIGNHFALMEGPIVLATLLRNARFEIDPSRAIEADTFATLRPRGGVPAVVKFRKRLPVIH